MAISRKNHWARNIITRGNMNISALTRGFILPTFKFVIRRRRGGSSVQGEGYGHLKKELHKLTGKTYEDIELIEVYVDWNKDVDKYGKKIYAKLIEKKIEAQLLKYTDKKYTIKAEIIKNKK